MAARRAPNRSDLKRALKKTQNSTSALASRLGISPSTVRRWIKKGLPKTKKYKEIAQERLRRFFTEELEVKEKEKSDVETFEELMKLAGEKDILPDTKTKEGTRAGAHTSGYSWVKTWKRIIDEDLIKEVLSWAIAKRQSRKFPLWQLTGELVQYTKRRTGYQTIIIQLKHPEAGSFVQSIVATPKSKNFKSIIDEFESRLKALIEVDIVTMLYSTSLYNYRLRTEQERRDYETIQRRKRRKKRKKK